MNTSKISVSSRVTIFFCALALIIVLFIPIWRIELVAPQYPEGLTLLIHADKIAGDVDIVNGLNHYIGMKTLHSKDFVEFTVLPFIILFFAVAFIIVSLLAKRKWIYWLLSLFVLFGILAMIDFWRWEYNYGHNLNPDAAIIVPGMAYQPPLIGFKQLLNFGAYSIPDVGGWIFVGVGVVLLLIVIFEWRYSKKNNISIPTAQMLPLALGLLFFSSCNAVPQSLNLGIDHCSSCKMTISDERFGGELVTVKSKVYKFDDVHCLVDFMKSGLVDQSKIAGLYFTNFNSPHQLIPSKAALFFKSDELRSPMNGNIAAFDSKDSLKKAMNVFPGKTVMFLEFSK